MVLVTTWKENEETQYLETRVRKSFCTFGLILISTFEVCMRKEKNDGSKYPRAYFKIIEIIE